MMNRRSPTITDSSKGIVLDGSSHTVLDGVAVSNIGDEGVHFRANSSDNTLRNSSIHDTGKSQPGYGEGLYFGSAQSNWSKYGENGGTGEDRSNNNRAIGNHGSYPSGTLADDYQTHQILAPYGCGNVWQNNVSDLGGVGAYAINVTNQSKRGTNPNVVYSSNSVTGATAGLTNIAVTSGG
jgi:hypothetical protein